MDLRSTLLSLTASPDRAWLMLLAGILLIARELTAPGRVLPGILGGVAVLTAATALAEYHLTPPGLGLLAAGVALILVQGFRHWWLLPGAAGALSFGAGARFLIAEPSQISWRTAALGVAVAGICAGLLRIAVRAHRNKVASR